MLPAVWLDARVLATAVTCKRWWHAHRAGSAVVPPGASRWFPLVIGEARADDVTSTRKLWKSAFALSILAR